MRRTLLRVLPVLALVSLGTALFAADVPLDSIPKDASVVLRLKSPKDTAETLATMIDQIQPGMGGVVRQRWQGVGVTISNPTLAGVDQSKDWWAAVFLRPEEEPVTVFYIPASDAKAMRNALGQEQNFLERQGYGIYTTDEDTFANLKSQSNGNSQSIAQAMDKATREVFDSGEVSLFINIAALKTTFSEQLKDFREKARANLEQAQAQQPNEGVNPSAAKAAAENMDRLLQALQQLIDDSQACALTLDVAKEGLVFQDYLKVAADSQTSKYFQKNKPAKMDLLNQLPKEQVVYVGMNLDVASLQSWSMDMMKSMFQDNPEGQKAIQQSLEGLKQIKFGEIAYAVAPGGEKDGAVRVITLTEATPTAKVRQLARDMAKSLKTIKAGNIQESFELKPDAETYGQYKADVQIVQMKVDDPQQQKLLDTIFGPDGMMTRTVYLDDKIVQTFGGGKEAMAAALEQLKSPRQSNTNGPMQAERKELPTESNILALLDLPGIVAGAARVASRGGLFPVKLDDQFFNSLGIQKSYMGFAVAAESQGLRVKTHLPVTQLRGIAQLVGAVQMRMMQQQQQQQPRQP